LNEALARELDAAENRRRGLHDCLMSLSFWLPPLPGEPRRQQFPVSSAVLRSLNSPFIDQIGPHRRPIAVDDVAEQRWRRWFEALLTDADAQFVL
jgi:hypothetical protein